MNSKEHNSYSTAAFARPSTEYDLMDGTVASQAEVEGRRQCHLHVPVMDGEWVPDGAKRVGEKLSCPASEPQRKVGSEATSAAKVQADIEHSAAARCDGLVNDDEFLVMVHPAPKTLAYVTALDDLAKWSMETCARNRHPPLTAMSGV
ncbi:hypothetical protein E4U60_004384 [Claviceps pazoutovae]|uniref:Uncharacterized protein n=1 Tax=Claviceps pazoutovae TaxID=1649127 RepID=A0A9P7MHK8_9HYPO|nr:hypothetical protein E4U60_004384 [Claviceps pazoutovae]